MIQINSIPEYQIKLNGTENWDAGIIFLSLFNGPGGSAITCLDFKIHDYNMEFTYDLKY